MRAKTKPLEDELFIDIELALAQLRDPNALLSATLLSTLSGIKRADLQAFATTWVQLPVARRRSAANRLAELSAESARVDFGALFRYLLNDEDAPVRVAAIAGLWEDEDSALVKPLVGFLRSDPDANVRVAAADGLGRFVLSAEYDRLGSALADLIHDSLLATLRNAYEAVEVRAHALESLGYSSRDGVSALLRAAYHSAEAQLHISAIAAMGRSADSQWRELVAAELESPDARAEAARALGELESRAHVPRIAELLDDPDRQVQTAALGALGKIGGKRAKRALEQVAASGDPVLSALADDALEEIAFSAEYEMPLLDLSPAGETDYLLDEDEEDDDDEDEDGEEEPDDEDEE